MRLLKLLSLALGLLLLPSTAFAQSVRYQSQAISSRGAGIANATIAVCTQPANTNTQPCSPLATLATSTSTTSGGANPLTADSFGNFFFYAAPGRYTVQIYGPAVSGQFVTPDVEIGSVAGGSAGAFSSLTVSGTGTFTGVSTNCKGNGAAFLDAANTCGWSGATADLQIAAIATYLGANGGNVYLGSGTFTVSNTLTINTPIKIYGVGGATGPNSLTPLLPTQLNCGIIAGPCILYSSVSGASNHKLQNAGLQYVSVRCNGNSQIGVQVLSVSHSEFKHLYVDQCTVAGLDFNVVASLGDPKDDQENEISDVSIDEGILAPDANGHGMRVGGDTVSNFSGNHISTLRVTHKNGNGVFVNNADHNYWHNISVTLGSGGTGIGIYLHGNGTPAQSPRGESFERISAGAGLFVQDGGAIGNSISDFSGDDIGRVPTVSTGALIWTECGLGTASCYQHITRGSGSVANVTQYDTSTAGLATCESFSDATVQKFTLCKDALNNLVIFDPVLSSNRLVFLAGGGSQIVSPSGTDVQLITNGGGGAVRAQGPVISTGTAATLTGTGACATITNTAGAANGGTGKCTGTTGASTLTITFGATAANGWVCDVWDETTRANLFQQTSHTGTTCVLTATSITQNDVFVFKAIGF